MKTKAGPWLRYLPTLCFLLILALYAAAGAHSFGWGMTLLFQGKLQKTASVEKIYNDSFPRKDVMITLNGGLMRLMGQRVVNESYRLDNGQLTYVIPRENVAPIAENTVAFADWLREQKIPFLYVNAPFKVDPSDKQLPPTVEDFSNENADDMLALLRQAGVDTLDLRERERVEGLDHASLFYPTDHHWTAETGFWAFTEIAEALRQRDASFAVDGAVLDAENYQKTVYKNVLLGSQGRRVGPWYAGMDDLSVISPAFDTHLCFSVPELGLTREGSYDETVLFPEKLTEGPLLETSRYDVYCGGEYDLMRLENLDGGNGKRLLVLKDSFSLVVAPFMALGYDTVDFLDLRLYRASLTDYICETGPDMVLVLYNPGALESNNTRMFEFLSS